MTSVAFDTLKLAQRLEAAGFPAKQAQDMASAISDTIVDTVVTREYLDLRLGEIRVELAELKSEMLKWMSGAVGLQTLAILGGVAALFRLLG
jgi:type II secretory pathway component PulM